MSAPAPSEERLARLTRLAARGFKRVLSQKLAAHGVSFGQWIFLRILWAEDGLSQRELAARAGLTEPTAHSAILRLEAAGLVARRPEDGNRRRHHVGLTAEGARLRSVLEPLAVETNAIAVMNMVSCVFVVVCLRISILLFVEGLFLAYTGGK